MHNQEDVEFHITIAINTIDPLTHIAFDGPNHVDQDSMAAIIPILEVAKSMLSDALSFEHKTTFTDTIT